MEIRREAADELTVLGLSARSIAEAAFARGILITGLIPQQETLEDAYMELTGGEVEYQSQQIGAQAFPANEGQSE